MEANNRPIGIFDSGIGGLTVTREVIKALPNEEIVYFGDTARVPYGNKSARTVVRFSVENTQFLLKFGVKFIVVACNTSSSLALPELQKNFKVPILGVISPAVKKAVEVSANGRVGIVATRATVASGCYQQQIKEVAPRFSSYAAACPLFVPLAEEGWLNGEVALKVAEQYLRPLLKKRIDTLILGCTHYPLLKGIMRKVLGGAVKFVDSAQETAKEAARMLGEGALLVNQGSSTPVSAVRRRFFTSDEPEQFKKIGRRFLGEDIQNVYHQGPVAF